MTDRRGVLFDMDGLLLDTERVSMETFVALVHPYGLTGPAAESFFLTLIGSSGAQTERAIAERLPDVDITQLRKDWHAAFLEAIADDVPVMEGVRETIGALAAAGRDMAVVTSTETHHAREELRRAGLLDAFQDVIGGDAVSANKPDPAPYLKGASVLGRQPENCVAFEDSDRGVTSAVRAGCTVWQVPDLRPADVPLPDLGQSLAKSLSEAVRGAGLL